MGMFKAILTCSTEPTIEILVEASHHSEAERLVWEELYQRHGKMGILYSIEDIFPLDGNKS